MAAIWWNTARIESTVTRDFVSSRIPTDRIDDLDAATGFGDGLTDGTYWEWIEDKAKRIFLILDDIGIPENIFGVVDNSWDDGDLPISFEQLDRLTGKSDVKLNWKFYDRQFYYMLKEIDEGIHTIYEDDEVVPINVVEKRPVAALNQNHSIDKVIVPSRPDLIFSRRRIPIASIPKDAAYEDFLGEVRRTRNSQNEHVVSYFASYTHLGTLYVLFTSSDYSLKNLLATMPAPLKALSKPERRAHTMNWIHCLVDGLCYLHSKGRSHRNIKPSTILFDSDHRILLADTAHLNVESGGSSSDTAAFNKESYDYAAPEQWFRPSNTNSAHRKGPMASSMTSSAGNYSLSISRGGPEFSSAHHAITPKLDPQAADVFSLGCIILELLSLQMKRTSKSFASHRGAKHKSAGRGGAVLDTSFHKNLGQVESWMAGLAKDASKKDEPIFHGVAPTLQLVARMLSVSPLDRPTAREVEQHMYRTLTEHCQILEPHCVHQYGSLGSALDDLRLSDDPEDISIYTKRHSGNAWPLGHRRSTSSATPRSPRDSGFHAMQAMRAPGPQNWAAPVYAGGI
ncbi:hypothetical protein JX265_010673 [Neoarthrinium moseri]|uniref:Protein kinase domain-containing protein n=1 Tax=Neoarthrinium moseri TaxID=1658444 RepID=A0A9P9WDX9_9PEZI|nr:hypothetical protein JX266_007451 [Neoarthrinium moseri]KAI1858580.1 hypothetical protein JX265_010673 [Neoarthrinium moseri]